MDDEGVSGLERTVKASERGLSGEDWVKFMAKREGLVNTDITDMFEILALFEEELEKNHGKIMKDVPSEEWAITKAYVRWTKGDKVE